MRRLVLGLWLAALGALPSLAHAGAEVTHPQVCGAAATPSTTDIDCADWNAAHVWGGTGAAQGTVPYYDAGETTKLNWATELLYDETTFSLRLFGGGVGTNGINVLSLGCTSTDPTTSPAESAQLWCKNLNGANTGGLVLRDELGGLIRLGSTAATDTALQLGSQVLLRTGSGEAILGTLTTDPLLLRVNDTTRVALTDGGNVGLNGATTFGPSAAGVVALKLGTCETASVTDQAGLCVRDRNGAATAEFARRNEEGHLESFAAFVHARSTTEATTTNSAVDLHTLNTAVSVPVTDGVIIRGAFRKSAGAAATCSIGLKINTTQIIPNTAVCSSTNQAENGFFIITVWNRAANYLRALKGDATNNVAGTATALFATADLANAAITDIRITGVTGSASVTLGVRDVMVERIAGH